jgi:hypothetical protein
MLAQHLGIFFLFLFLFLFLFHFLFLFLFLFLFVVFNLAQLSKRRYVCPNPRRGCPWACCGLRAPHLDLWTAAPLPMWHVRRGVGWPPVLGGSKQSGHHMWTAYLAVR